MYCLLVDCFIEIKKLIIVLSNRRNLSLKALGLVQFEAMKIMSVVIYISTQILWTYKVSIEVSLIIWK